MNAFEANQIGYELYEKEQRANRYSKRYIKRNLKNVRDFIEYQSEHGKPDVRKIRKKDIIMYYNYLKSRHNKKSEGTLALVTVEGIISSISGFYSTLYRNMIIRENTFHTLQLRQPHSRDWKRKPFTKVEIEKFLESIETDTPKGLRDRTIFELMYSSGLRLCEISGLKIGDIDFNQREMIVRGKFGTDRMVPVSEVAIKFLQLYLGKRIEEQDRPVFPGEVQTQGLRAEYIGCLFRSYLRKSGMQLECVSAHSIRHSTATHLLDNGASIRHVQELLGHRNIKTTVRYTHLQTEGVGRIYRKYHPREHELFDSVDEKYFNDVDFLVNQKLARRKVKSEPAKNLRKLRMTAGITRYKLAELLGIAYGTLAGYENEKCSITEEKACQLARIFNVDKQMFL